MNPLSRLNQPFENAPPVWQAVLFTIPFFAVWVALSILFPGDRPLLISVLIGGISSLAIMALYYWNERTDGPPY